MKMKLKRFLLTIATTAVLCVLAPLAGAALVTTDQAISSSLADQERARVQALLERADAREQLRALGIDSATAQERVARLTDAEVHTLAGKINSLPMGGDLSSNDIIIILLVAILVVLVL
jgi:hypothetical protein